MLIFLAYESATTPFCLCLLLSACGILLIFWWGEDLIWNFAKPPVDMPVGGKRRALAHQEAEIDTMAPVMVGSCSSPHPLCADQTGDTSWNLFTWVAIIIRSKGVCYQLESDLKQRSRHKWFGIFQWDSESQSRLCCCLSVQRISSYFGKE